jgi:hypothetical protein
MSAGKVIESVIIFGGIGAMAYLLFRKPTPLKENCEYDLNWLNTKLKNIQYQKSTNRSPNAYTQIKKLEDEYDVLKAKYDSSQCGKITNVNPMSSQLYGVGLTIDDYRPQKDFDKDSAFRDSPLNKPLLDPEALKSQQLKANTCNELDKAIPALDNEKVQWIKLGGMTNQLGKFKPIIDRLTQTKTDAEAKFNKFNCRDKIEAERTKTLVDLQTKGSIKAEEAIVNKGFTEQKAYIILGALVLLTGFYVVVKK